MSSTKIILVAIIVSVLSAGAYLTLHRKAAAPAAVVQTPPGTLRYLPLGDSYTIGSSVSESQRWPNQLVAKLAKEHVALQIVDNPARLGYTSQNLIDRELPLVGRLNPDIVSVQIGVNDYVQGVALADFTRNLSNILDQLQRQVAQPKNIFLVTIPDYAKTPAGAQYGDPVAANTAITEFNQVIVREAAARGLPVADIFAISQQVTSNPSLTAPDGLHPSGAQYALWVDQIYATLKQTALLGPEAAQSSR